MLETAPRPPKATYGVRSLQEMRKSTKLTEGSLKIRKNKEEMYNYFSKEVDPIVSDTITYLLILRPSGEVANAMLDYLMNHRGSNPVPVSCAPNTAKKEQRLYLATKISPILTKLVNRIASAQPTNVVEFMCNELSAMIVEGKEIAAAAPIPVAPSNKARPSSAYTKKSTDQAQFSEKLAYNNNSSNSPNARPGTAPLNSTAPFPVSIPDVKPVEVRNMQIIVLGPGGSGKSTLINALQGKSDASIRPTLGFRPVTMMLDENTKVRFYDLGGGPKIRDIWNQYYHDVHAVIFMVDGAAADSPAKIAEIKEMYESAMGHATMTGKPLLMLSNKQDVEGCITAEDLAQRMDLSSSDMQKAMGWSSLITDGEMDPRVEQGIEWLIETIKKDFEQLNARVVADTEKKLKDEMHKRLQRERKVLRNKIASAFSEIIPNFEAIAGEININPEEIYDPEGGISFMAAEIGEEVQALEPDAVEVAALIGYQRLALQIVGALRSPISKKKVPMTWAEIKKLVLELRAELGI